MIFDSKETFHAWATRSKAGKRNAKAVEQASEADRQWFEQHPGATEYARAPIPHEFPPMPGQKIDAVRVMQMRPGVRMRVPLTAVVVLLGVRK